MGGKESFFQLGGVEKGRVRSHTERTPLVGGHRGFSGGRLPTPQPGLEHLYDSLRLGQVGQVHYVTPYIHLFSYRALSVQELPSCPKLLESLQYQGSCVGQVPALWGSYYLP